MDKDQKEELTTDFYKQVIVLLKKNDEPEALYVMARVLSLLAITKAEEQIYGFLTIQNALNDAMQELIEIDLEKQGKLPPAEEDFDDSFDKITDKKNKSTLH
tara:strand:- start:1180 stop:1485 length:306 start_codon:yes stop_codon:yes gene_type:complete